MRNAKSATPVPETFRFGRNGSGGRRRVPEGPEGRFVVRAITLKFAPAHRTSCLENPLKREPEQ